MDETIQVLAEAGYRVHVMQAQVNHAIVFEVNILTQDYLTGHKIHELWIGKGASVREALLQAGFKLQQHMRPVYENYLVLADAFHWSADEPYTQ